MSQYLRVGTVDHSKNCASVNDISLTWQMFSPTVTSSCLTAAISEMTQYMSRRTLQPFSLTLQQHNWFSLLWNVDKQHVVLVALRLLHFVRVVDDAKCIVVMRVCVSVHGRMPTLLHRPGCNLGEWSGRGCPLVVHYWADLQSAYGLHCYGNTRKLEMRGRAQR